MEIRSPQDPGRLDMDFLENVGRLYDQWFAPASGAHDEPYAARKEEDIRGLLKTCAFEEIRASTDSQLALCRDSLGNTNFPGCICPPKKRNGEPTNDDHVDSDFCAVYLPERRDIHQKEIWISVRGTACFAHSLSRISSGNPINEEIYGFCRAFLYYHEIFHFNVERALRRLAGNVGAEGLWWNAYVASWGTYDCIEEGMAEAFALQRMKRLPARYQGYIEPLKTLILKSTPGYSSGVAIAERYEEFKRFFFSKVAGVTGVDDFHEAAFLKMLEDETPRECKVFYVLPVATEQKQKMTDYFRSKPVIDIATVIAGSTDLPDISPW
jgi:hypothetical protein